MNLSRTLPLTMAAYSTQLGVSQNAPQQGPLESPYSPHLPLGSLKAHVCKKISSPRLPDAGTAEALFADVGLMEKKMETTIKVWDLGFWV